MIREMINNQLANPDDSIGGNAPAELDQNWDVAATAAYNSTSPEMAFFRQASHVFRPNKN